MTGGILHVGVIRLPSSAPGSGYTLAMWWMWISVVLAAGPASRTPNVAMEDDWVTGQVWVDIPQQRAVAEVTSPIRVAELHPTAMKVTQLAENDNCRRINYHQDHWLARVDYDIDACETGHGWTESLKDAEVSTFHQYEAEWRLVAQDEGTRIEIRVISVPKLKVPQWLVNQQSRKAVRETLTVMQGRLEALSPPATEEPRPMGTPASER